MYICGTTAHKRGYMTLWSRLATVFERVATELAPAPTQKLKTKTKAASGGSKKQKQNLIGSSGGRNKDTLKKWKEIYENGGAESQALETYALFIMANGYRLEGENPSLVQKCQDFINSFDFDDTMYKGIIDAGWSGDGIQEIAAGRISTTRLEGLHKKLGNITAAELELEVKLAAIKGGDILALVPREAESFEPEWDDNGMITGWVQTISTGGGSEQKIKLKPEQILHIKFFGTGGSIHGLSMYQRAYDEIMRDTRTAEASAEAIDRHGFKKWHIKAGQPGETVSDSDINELSTRFQEINTRNEFVTTADVEIKDLDDSGLDKVEDYNDISIMRMCAAMGIPEELLGMRRGSTDATAVERIKIFLKRITAMQKRLAKIYNINVFDRITGKPGAVKLVFNDCDPSDEATNAKWMAELMKASPTNPFAVLSVEYIQQRLNIVPKLAVGDGNPVKAQPQTAPPAKEPAAEEAAV